MPKFIGGFMDHKLTAPKEVRETLVQPLRGSPYVAIYKRRWEDGDYWFAGLVHENDVLGPVGEWIEPCPPK